MPFETPTLPALVSRVQSDLSGDALRRSDALVLSRAQAGAVYGLYGFLDWIAAQILPDTADEETLIRQAQLRLKSGRKPAVAAQGAASFTAAPGAGLAAGALLQYVDGRQYRVAQDVIASPVNTTAQLEAVDAGLAGDLAAGATLSLVVPVEGFASDFIVTGGGITGGSDQEGVEALRQRVIRSYRVIPHGGSAKDYETWALEVPGVTRAWPVRNYLGPGTVGLFFVREGDADPIPDAAERQAVKDYIEQQRPVTAELYVLSPKPRPVNYTIRVTPDTVAVRAAVEAELRDLHDRESDLGATLLLSHIREAVSGATGETDHAVTVPAADVVPAADELLTFGVITWL